mmetsp:Transcript_10920/g.16501  ORF Transcript_10920/g.16501 Transcript_10920/m.16501 type:complete len:98 (-) Transcript_10920:89-382(-)
MTILYTLVIVRKGVYWKPPLTSEEECLGKSSLTHYWVSDLGKFKNEVALHFSSDAVEIWMDHHGPREIALDLLLSHGIIFFPVSLPGSSKVMVCCGG